MHAEYNNVIVHIHNSCQKVTLIGLLATGNGTMPTYTCLVLLQEDNGYSFVYFDIARAHLVYYCYTSMHACIAI